MSDMNQEQRQAYEWAKKQNYPSVAARYAKILAGLVDEITPPNEPLTLEHLRASPHGKIKDSTLQSICNRANEIACRPPEGEEDSNV